MNQHFSSKSQSECLSVCSVLFRFQQEAHEKPRSTGQTVVYNSHYMTQHSYTPVHQTIIQSPLHPPIIIDIVATSHFFVAHALCCDKCSTEQAIHIQLTNGKIISPTHGIPLYMPKAQRFSQDKPFSTLGHQIIIIHNPTLWPWMYCHLHLIKI